MNYKSTSFFLALLLLLSSAVYSQSAFHVYSNEIPWKNSEVIKEEGKTYSIAEAIQNASAGDSIIIHEGIYRETLKVDKDNLVIENYQNEYVLVTGSEVVTNWTKASGMADGVMVADISSFTIETPYTQLFANGVNQMMARHPNNTTGDMMEPMDLNSGYALLSNVHKDAGVGANGYATLEGTTLPDVDLTNGIFRGTTGKMRHYVFGKISASSGNSVTFKGMNNSIWKEEAAIKNTQIKFSWGFVMHKNLIDVAGEWYAENEKLYYLPEEGKNIDSTRIEIQVRERVLVLNNTTGATIKGINFIAGNTDMQNTNGATIEACSMRYLHPFWTPNGYGQGDTDKKGVYLSNSSDNMFKDNYIAHSWGNMFALHDGQNNSFQNCIIKDFGWVGVFTSGIHINESDNTNINNCTFGDAGRFQVRVDGGDAKVNIMDCDFYGSMQMGEDAGPIEATSTGRIGTIDMKGSVIAYNKVHDVIGVPISNGNYNKVKATAFYMEDVENYTAHHNLIYNIKHDAYDGPHEITRTGEFLYLGPRYNAMHKPVKYYNNTIWNVDENISIWNVQIDNWEELGITPPDTTGLIENGHFANNIFMNGPIYKMSTNRQVLNSKGGKIDWAQNPEGGSISTYDFTEYVAHSAKWGYHLNPENNQFYDFADADKNFADTANGGFSLLTASSSIGAGVALGGITSSAMPDCGALEGGNRVLNAGAVLSAPDFQEEGTNFIPPTEWVKLIDFKTELPDTTTLFEFDVHYNTFEQRDIIVALYTPEPENVFVNNSKVTVSKGSDTVTVAFMLDSPQPAASDYKVLAALRPVDGNWQTNIAVHTLYTNLATPKPETVDFKGLPSEMYPTDKTIAFDVDYAINSQRKLLVSLISPSNETVALDSVLLKEEDNTTSFTLELTDTLSENSTYTVKLAVQSVNESPEYIVAEASKPIKVLPNPPLSLGSTEELKPIVYPNPTQDILNIQITQNNSRNLQVEIYSTTGVLMYADKVTLNATSAHINTANLPNGAYILRIQGYLNVIFSKN
ncbi:T9SS type A sorting domain-containing protein [Flammeovirgaceae bacterium SG7u.111]|nr:T9SS type A sorting domain-containing protein [Flammeovirgaceae bacterium SG7u.132]WPO34436.1 T9SS type A sorting domain-containing protein [Flammeovirgaceae bacterium SG7u.111]